jgi:hypothetical protein
MPAHPYATADVDLAGARVEAQRFRVARSALVAIMGSFAVLGLVVGAVLLVADRPWWNGVALLLQAALVGALVFVLGRQTVVLTGDGIQATQGFQRQRVAWSDVQRVHLDWAAEAAGRDRDVLRVEHRSGTTVRSSAAMGMDGATERSEGARLETALRERAAVHGFAVEVTLPSWKARSRDAGRAKRPVEADPDSRGKA